MGVVLARPIVLIPHLFRLSDMINFRKDYLPPLVHHLDPTSGIKAKSLICGLHQPERMASSGLDDCDTHFFYGTYFARWKHHMIDHIRVKGPKFWWVVISGLTHVLDHKNLTKAQKVLFELDSDAYLFLMDAFDVSLGGTYHETFTRRVLAPPAGVRVEGQP